MLQKDYPEMEQINQLMFLENVFNFLLEDSALTKKLK
jgi:hypothetical protein